MIVSVKIYYILILALLLGAGCKKDKVVQDTSRNEIAQVEVIWRKHLFSGEETYPMSPVITSQQIVFGSFEDEPFGSSLLFFDKQDGTLTKEWVSFAGDPGLPSWENQHIIGDTLYISSAKYVQCIDLSKQVLVWSTDHSSRQGNGLTYINNGYIYRSYRSNGYLPNLTGTIIRSPLDHEDWQQVYSYTADDDYSVSLSCMTTTFLPNGDELLLFKNRQWHFDLSQGRMDVFAYNLTADSLLWRNEGLEMWDGGVMPLKIDDSLVFCPGGRYFYALNLYTGEKIWEFDYAGRSPGNHFGYGDVFINGKLLVVKPSGDELFCLTKTTGRLNWWKENKGWTMKGRFTHFENKLFYIADADLIIVDDYTGERLLPEDRQEHLGKLTGDVRIDPSTRLMYMANYHEALCVKIPDDL